MSGNVTTWYDTPNFDLIPIFGCRHHTPSLIAEFDGVVCPTCGLHPHDHTRIYCPTCDRVAPNMEPIVKKYGFKPINPKPTRKYNRNPSLDRTEWKALLRECVEQKLGDEAEAWIKETAGQAGFHCLDGKEAVVY